MKKFWIVFGAKVGWEPGKDESASTTATYLGWTQNRKSFTREEDAIAELKRCVVADTTGNYIYFIMQATKTAEVPTRNVKIVPLK